MPKYKISSNKTGKVFDIEWMGDDPPDQAQAAKLVADLEAKQEQKKQENRDGISGMFADIKDDLYKMPGMLEESLTKPIVNLKPYAQDLYESFNPSRESVDQETEAAGFKVRNKGQAGPADAKHHMAKEGVGQIADFLSPAPIDIATMSLAKVGKGAKAVKAPKKATPVRTGAEEVVERVPSAVSKEESVLATSKPQPSQEEVIKLLESYKDDPYLKKMFKESSERMRREQVRRVLADSGVGPEDIKRVEDEYFASGEALDDVAKRNKIEMHGGPGGIIEGAADLLKNLDPVNEGAMTDLVNNLTALGLDSAKIQGILRNSGIKPRSVGLNARSIGDNPRQVGSNLRADTARNAVKSVPEFNGPIDPDNLPLEIPDAYVAEVSKATGLDPKTVKTALKQTAKQQQLKKAKNAIKQHLGSQRPQAATGAQTGSATAPGSVGGQAPPVQPPSASGMPSGGAPTPPPAGQPPNPVRRKATWMENIMGFPRSVKSMIDLPLLRQGVIQAIAHPKSGWDAAKAGFKSYSNKGYDEVMQGIQNRPRYEMMKDTGVLDPDVGQHFPSTWAEAVPGVKRSEQAYVGSMDTLRANRFDDLAGKIEEDFFKSNPMGPIPRDQFDTAAKMVRDTTGSSQLPKAISGAGPVLNSIFYSPRFRMSRLNNIFDTATGGMRYGKDSKLVQKEFLKDMGKFGAGTGAGLAGAKYGLDADIELNPTSSDFLQANIGDTRIDMLGGLKPAINLVSRMASGQQKSPKTDEIRDISPLDAAGYYLRTGVAPGLQSMAIDGLDKDLRTGNREDVMGRDINRSFGDNSDFVPESMEDTPYLPWLANQVIPMFPQDAYEMFKKQGAAKGLPMFALGSLGAGLSTFDSPNQSGGSQSTSTQKEVVKKNTPSSRKSSNKKGKLRNTF